MALILILFAGFRQHLQRIHIEEFPAVQRHSADHAVIERAFQHVHILRILCVLKHPAGEEAKPDGRAGLAVYRIVGQVIVKGKRLPICGRADSTGYVHSPVDQIVPQALTGLKKLCIFCLGRHIRNAGIQIYGADGMPLRLRLFPHGQCGLIILESQGSTVPAVLPGLFSLVPPQSKEGTVPADPQNTSPALRIFLPRSPYRGPPAPFPPLHVRDNPSASLPQEPKSESTQSTYPMAISINLRLPVAL